MSSYITAGITGVPLVAAKLQSAVVGLKSDMVPGMHAVLNIIKARALPRTPRDTGTLRGSIYTRVSRTIGRVDGEIGYTAYYAIYVHECNRHYREPGTSWKFLSRSLRPTMELRMALEAPMRRRLHR